MKRIRLFLIIVLTVVSLAVQAEVPPLMQKKLQAINADHPIKPEDMRKQIMEIYNWCRENDRPDVLARLLTRYGTYLQALGFYDISSDILRSSTYFLSEEEEKVKVFTEANRAIADFHNGFHKESENTLNEIEGRVAKMEENVPQQLLLQTIQTYLGEIYQHTGREARAYANYKKALDITTSLGDKRASAELISRICNLDMKVENADSLYEEGLKMAMESENGAAIYSLLMVKSRMEYRNTEYEKALIDVDNAERFARNYLDPDSVVDLSGTMCDYLLVRSDCYAGLKEYGRAYDTMNIYLYQKERRNSHQKELHKEHWKLGHDLIALSDKYRSERIADRNIKRTYIWILSIVTLGSIILFIIVRRKQIKQKKSSGRKIKGYVKKLDELSNDLTDIRQDKDRVSQEKESLLNALQNENERSRQFKMDSTRYRVMFNARNEFLGKIKEMIREGYKMRTTDIPAHLKKISASITQGQDDDAVDLMKEIYSEHEEFFKKLSERSNSLSENEKRLALYIHLGLTTREIARMTGSQVKTVSVSRFRLRKNLGYESDMEMNSELRGM
ncbi:MAG: hypothetical protein HDS28_06740 [Bacteroides sp.]|nr:hypothetical protein [Bacteroides sp.]